MSEASRTSDNPICPLCDQRIYGGCMCISAEYSVRITELQAKLSDASESYNQFRKAIGEQSVITGFLIIKFTDKLEALAAAKDQSDE